MDLLDQLAAGARFDAEYRGNLSNHLPMALAALHRLGADADRLAAFERGYALRLAPAPPIETWPAGDAWPARFGDPRAWPIYRSLFRQWIEAEGAADMLAQVLPPLFRGSGAAAFHGLIRSAYAAQMAPAGELADALAYWACRWLELPPCGAAGDEPDPARVLADLPARRVPGQLIVDRMVVAAHAPGHAATVAALRIDEGTLERLARLAAQLYARTGDFTVLHLVTGCHAARVLVGFVDDRRAAVADFWRAFAAGACIGGLGMLEPAEPLAWEAIVAAAMVSEDEHVIKLVDACREQERAHGGEAWRLAASRCILQATN